MRSLVFGTRLMRPLLVEYFLQALRRVMLLCVEVNVQDGVGRQVGFQLLYFQSLEQLFLALEVGFQRAQQPG